MIIKEAAIIIIMNTFQITSQVSSVFPDIEQQLCSKHTVLLNSIHKKFNQTYPNHQPTHYVIVNDSITIVKGMNASISMTMEQGLTMLLCPGKSDEDLYISSNIFEEVILTKSGKLINLEHEPEFSSLAKKSISLAVQDLSLNKVKGGFIFLHFSDSQGEQSCQSLLIGLFMAGIVMNGLVQEYDEDELIGKLRSLQEFKDNNLVENYFKHYRNRELLLKTEQGNSVSYLDPKYKFLFLSFSVLDAEGTIDEKTLSHSSFDKIIQQFQHGSIELTDLFSSICQLQKQQVKHQECFQIANNIMVQFKLKGYIFCSHYCIFLVESYRYAEVIGQASKLVHQMLAKKQDLKGKQQGLITRNSVSISASKIKSLLFSSVPSTGLAVFNPQKELWF